MAYFLCSFTGGVRGGYHKSPPPLTRKGVAGGASVGSKATQARTMPRRVACGRATNKSRERERESAEGLGRDKGRAGQLGERRAIGQYYISHRINNY